MSSGVSDNGQALQAIASESKLNYRRRQAYARVFRDYSRVTRLLNQMRGTELRRLKEATHSESGENMVSPSNEFLNSGQKWLVVMFRVTSPIVINVPTRGLLAVETMHAIVRWLANLNINVCKQKKIGLL